MTTTTERYTAEQLLDKAKRFDWTGAETAAMLEQAATDATRLQSLEAENARLRESLKKVADFQMDSLIDKAQCVWHLQYIARNALKED